MRVGIILTHTKRGGLDHGVGLTPPLFIQPSGRDGGRSCDGDIKYSSFYDFSTGFWKCFGGVCGFFCFVLFFFLTFYSIISQLEIHFIIDFRLKEYEVYIVI